MQKVVAVVGGGIGGLSAGHHLSKSPNVSKVKNPPIISIKSLVNLYLFVY